MKRIIFLALITILPIGCNKVVLPRPKPVAPVIRVAPHSYPVEAKYKVVAHRGGSAEASETRTAPDNSRAALKYAMGLGCYASECDIYWTADDNVIVAHANGQYQINGVTPWDHTVSQIRQLGVLSNQEVLPTLDEFIDLVMVEGNCTKLWIDIKLVGDPQYSINAAKCACDIIKKRGAEHFCEFICTSQASVMAASSIFAKDAGVEIAWMSNADPSSYISNGYTWANLSAGTALVSDPSRVEDFYESGVAISVYNVDKEYFDGNSVYSDSQINYYVSKYPILKAICTNYPAWMINKISSK